MCIFSFSREGKLLVKEDPGLYHFINQGCLGVDGMDDQEEMQIADVSRLKFWGILTWHVFCLFITGIFNLLYNFWLIFKKYQGVKEFHMLARIGSFNGFQSF